LCQYFIDVPPFLFFSSAEPLDPEFASEGLTLLSPREEKNKRE
jgi:hypothetical protein